VSRRSVAGTKVLLTGAASGIGRACAYELARRGAELGLADIDAAGLEETASRIRATGGAVTTFVVDLARSDAIDALAVSALERMGGIDILVNNAGVAVVSPLLETSDESWDWIFRINVWAPIRLTRAIARHMVARGRGQIVFTASLAGLVAAPGMLPYSTTKFALVGFAEALRFEMAEAGVAVTVICPGYVRTSLHRATRYANEGFERFLDDPPAWYGLTPERAAAIIVGAIARRKPRVVFGIEKVGWWLQRAWPGLAFAITRRLARPLIAPGRGEHLRSAPR
jgi:short-subunit dehydrogenase